MTALYKQHPCVQAAKAGAAIKWDGGVGCWQVDDQSQRVLGGRVFHLAYKGARLGRTDVRTEDKWVSYSAAERKHKVSLYQWRAPGEWFAEIYANYFLGTLPEEHPLYAWFKDFIATNLETIEAEERKRAAQGAAERYAPAAKASPEQEAT